MPTEIILMDNVEHLGKIGDKVKVADGYARNYLFPKKLAVLAEKVIVKQLEAKKKIVAQREKEEIKKAQEKAKSFENLSIELAVQCDEEDKLFGAVSLSEIFDAIKKEKLELNKKQISIKNPLKTLGSHSIIIKLHSEVQVPIEVILVKANES